MEGKCDYGVAKTLLTVEHITILLLITVVAHPTWTEQHKE